ncbi:TraB/GumN family protein [Maribellus sediminis]|uniref:TraB/GumN family protein n=1 Tax=Maribellus sediminis TaxID=2696285 RepID=UPI001431F4A9|nr:TraB/GumN family protein [Maribellus sediminis]
MKHLLFTTAILLHISLAANSQSSVWKVEGNNTEFYIGGSFHILRNQDYPLPNEFYEAYDKSEILTTEMDMNEMNNPANALKVQQKLMFQDENTLRGVLSEEVYSKLDSVSKGLGMNIKAMDKFRPSMVVIALTFQSLQKLGVTTQGVDVHFTDKANRDAKSLLFLETFDEQLSFIESMGAGNENEFVLYSLEDIETNEKEFIDLIEDWKIGRQDLIEKQMQDFKLNYPDIYETLVVKRNNNWMSHLENYLKTPEVEFVIVGAAHLSGTDGVLNKLKQKGYNVSQLQ